MSEPSTTPIRIRPATASEIADWDALIETNPDGGHMVQSRTFADIKRFDGLTPRFLVFEGPQRIHVLVLEGKVSLGAYWYMPYGPTGEHMADLVAALRDYARPIPGLLVVKIEPRLPRSEAHIRELTALGLERSRDMQVMTHTVVLDLTQGADALFATFSKTIRNQVRGAARKGYRVERQPATQATFDRFYALMLTVAGGRGMQGMREREYYDVYWRAFLEADEGRIYFGYDDPGSDEPQAAIFFTHVGRNAVYKDAGSRPDRRIPGGSAALLWQAIQDCIELGKETIDLGGTPPADRIDDREHRFYGIGQFKRRFGAISSWMPSFDLVLHPVRHRVWEQVVRRVEWRIRRGPNTLR